MDYIKEYSYGSKDGKPIYIIDTNILFSMCQLYYKGVCERKEITDELKQFILKARKHDVCNKFAIIEACYDYTTNKLNTEQMNLIMIAYDNLLTSMSEQEVIHHNGTERPIVKGNGKRVNTFTSIFDCNLMQYLSQDYKAIINICYIIYLYFLKVYDLHNSHLNPMEKVRQYFEFMTNDIGIYMGTEFTLGSMLFIGDEEANGISSKILKLKKSPNISHIINAVVDVFQFTMIKHYMELFVKNRINSRIIFVTADEALQKYMELTDQSVILLTNGPTISINSAIFNVRGKYWYEWNEFKERIHDPYCKKRIQSASENNSKDIIDRIRTNISFLEKKVLCNQKR